MSDIIALSVHIIPIKDNFVHLHSNLLSNYKFNDVKLDVDSKSHYVSCSSTPFNMNGENAMNISNEFANTLNLKEYETVLISNTQYIKSLKVAHVSPISDDDLTILQNNTELIQTSLLNQVRVVQIHQKLNIWITKTFSLKVHIDNLNPASQYGKLEEYSEVIVSMSVNECQNCDENQEQESENIFSLFNPWNLFDRIFNTKLGESIDKSSNTETTSHVIENKEFYGGVFRCALVNPEWKLNVPYYPYVAFISKDHCRFLLKPGYSLCRIKNLYGPFKDKNQVQNSLNEIVIQLYILDDEINDEYLQNLNTFPTLFITKSLYHSFDMTINSRVELNILSHNSNIKLTQINVEIVKLENENKNEIIENIQQVFSNYLRDKNEAIINNKHTFAVDQFAQSVVTLSFNPTNVDFAMLNCENFKNCTFYLNKKPSEMKFLECATPSKEIILNFQKPLIKDLFVMLLIKGNYLPETSLFKSNNVILEGDAGTGKSTVLNIVAQEAAVSSIYVKKLECKTLKGKLVSKLEKLFKLTMVECAYHQPAILCIDDLDILFPSVKQDAQHESANSVSSYANRLSHTITDIIRGFSHHNIAVLATATSVNNFQSRLFSCRGSSLFNIVTHVPNLNEEMRKECFHHFLQSENNEIKIEEILLSDFYRKTDGFYVQDMVDIAKRVYYQLLKRQVNKVDKELVVVEEDLRNVLDNFTPLSLIGVNLHKDTTVNWTDIGGLNDAKEMLTEILIWPSKYLKIYEQCPLKLQSGVLLYGAPGSGKTLLASAVAGESGLNFISIKGPELLSKYVGQSEEGVRNTFKRARNAKPCILFFDEFDSLAPRRGNDISGVTDRVVNQLLTELDGVESLSGVWILAASSKPELIDPALLRPGRLGTSIYCQLPDCDERYSILKVLLSKFELQYDADLNQIASATSGYTGADLRAVIYSATTIVKNDEPINTDCLLKAIANTPQSLSKEDRSNYENIYNRFQKKEVDPSMLVSQKLTYA